MSGGVQSVRPQPVTWQNAESKKGFATKCFVSYASKIGGEVSTQQPTEVGRDVEQPGSITPSVLKKHAPCIGFGLALRLSNA